MSSAPFPSATATSNVPDCGCQPLPWIENSTSRGHRHIAWALPLTTLKLEIICYCSINWLVLIDIVCFRLIHCDNSVYMFVCLPHHELFKGKDYGYLSLCRTVFLISDSGAPSTVLAHMYMSKPYVWSGWDIAAFIDGIMTWAHLCLFWNKVFIFHFILSSHDSLAQEITHHHIMDYSHIFSDSPDCIRPPFAPPLFLSLIHMFICSSNIVCPLCARQLL